MVKTVEGTLNAAGLRFGLVVSRFNSFIVEHLVSGAIDAIVRHGGRETDITVVRVPGSLEMPVVAQQLAQSKKFDAVVALGAIIRGSTSHYDLVCSETAKGLAKVALDSGLPVMFGVLTTDSIEQAIERAGTKAGNKGAEAAVGAIEMAQVLRALKE